MKIDWGRTLTSKTLWLNVLAVLVLIAQWTQGKPWMEPELQVLILAVLNALVRFVTNDSLVKKT